AGLVGPVHRRALLVGDQQDDVGTFRAGGHGTRILSRRRFSRRAPPRTWLLPCFDPGARLARDRAHAARRGPTRARSPSPATTRSRPARLASYRRSSATR